MQEPVFEKGYPSYEAVNRDNKKMSTVPTTDGEMVIWLHDRARITGNTFYREVADRFNELAKIVENAEKEAMHKAMQG